MTDLSIAVDNRAELWEPRRVVTLAQARGRTNLVGILRMLFTVGAAASAGVLLGYVVFHAISANSNVTAPPASGVTMLNPKFNGRDANGEPFLITASTAKRRRGTAEVIDLDQPVLEDGLGTNVRADEGVYDREARTLRLAGNVKLLDVTGYEFVSDAAIMHVEDNRIEGQSPLNGEGPLGKVRADTYKVIENGSKVVLTGNVWTQITFED